MGTARRITALLRRGEVVVEELTGGRILTGVEGIELIFRHIPAYTPFRLLFRVPSFRRYVEKEGARAMLVTFESRDLRPMHQIPGNSRFPAQLSNLRFQCSNADAL